MKWIKETMKPVHEDERRSLTAMFNGDFTAKQIKIIKVKKDSVLGNHYHNYRECFYVLKGRAVYTLEDVRTKEQEEVVLLERDRLIIDSKIAHKAFLAKDTVMLEGTEEEYISAKENDVRYEVE